MLADERILLRAPEPEDLDTLYRWENDTKLWQYGNTMAPLSKYILREYIRESAKDIYTTRQLRLMIVLQENPAVPVGAVDLFDFDPLHLRAGVGILMDEKFRQQGLAVNSIQLVLEYARIQLGLHQLYCHITSNNLASIQLFERMGFIQTGSKKHWTRIGTGWHDELIYQCLLIPEQNK